MLAVTVLVLAVAAVALFARDWRFGAHGPGIMTKIKIFITHFQVGTAQLSMHCTHACMMQHGTHALHPTPGGSIA